MKAHAAVLLLVCLCGLPVAAADFESQREYNWHQWRGPMANGVAPHGNPPTEWGEDKNIAWKTKIPGRGHSTPIVWGDQIFLLTAIETDRTIELSEEESKPVGIFQIRRPETYFQFVVLALDRKTGQIEWQEIATEAVPHEGHHQHHGYASGSPTTDGEQLYVSFGSRGVYCYDLSGEQKWQCDFGPQLTNLSFGEASYPTLHGDTVILTWDHEGESFIVALDCESGQQKWRVPRSVATTWATPLIVEHKGRTQVITSADERMYSYDLATGDLIWECGGLTSAAIPCPVAADGVVYCMTGYAGYALLAVSLDAEGDVTDSDQVLWTHDRATSYVPSPLLYDEKLYFISSTKSIVSCFDTSTGKPLFDRKRLGDMKAIYASPVGAAGKVYIAGRQGNCVVLKHGSSFEELAVNTLDGGIDASPAVVGDQIFIRGGDHLYCIEEK